MLVEDADGRHLHQQVGFGQRLNSDAGERSEGRAAEPCGHAGRALGEQRHALRREVHRVEGELDNVVQGGADAGQGGRQVEVALLDLSGDVTVADGSAVRVAGDLAGHEDQSGAGGDRDLPVEGNLGKARRVDQLVRTCVLLPSLR